MLKAKLVLFSKSGEIYLVVGDEDVLLSNITYVSATPATI